jgi:hypothetical protein
LSGSNAISQRHLPSAPGHWKDRARATRDSGAVLHQRISWRFCATFSAFRKPTREIIQHHMAVENSLPMRINFARQ